ncbi:beta-1,3-galactosyltransferase GALT1 [Impatiens glandulifera]|uniref:beta-1,3-galactosyltransferase GALT1 n=1 Tax=Impatiens glandulifera TaxID=253017 RepID=UPI001FB09BDA|nr:beta-1,3-galactosyltransferase GALT1 [Impatiens glandulifera]
MNFRLKSNDAYRLLSEMKIWYGGVIVASFFMLLFLRHGFMKHPVEEYHPITPFPVNSTDPIKWITAGAPQDFHHPENSTQVISVDLIVTNLFTKRNVSVTEQHSLQTWNYLNHLIGNAQTLPNAADAIKEAGVAWNSLMDSVEDETRANGNVSLQKKGNEKKCPQYLSKLNSTELDDNGFIMQVPCGLTQGSSITIIGIPTGLLGNFRIDLTGEPIPGEPDPPIVLHYNVRLHGDKITEDPVIVQNTWTAAHDWGEEGRCPSPSHDDDKKVDELDQCNEIVGREENRTLTVGRRTNNSRKIPLDKQSLGLRKYFPFKQGYLSVATLRVGVEGIHMTVDGKHVTSFVFRETLEPWLVSEVRVSGDIKLVSVVASGLPTSEDLEHVIDLEALIARPLSSTRPLELFVGVFSTTNNFKRRMAVRRTWMQYAAVQSGAVAVRFFVGLHKNQRVNEELWNEAQTYKDIQLMPFVDYYGLITWKTVAICIFGTEVAKAKFIMKTDDDAFVRVDEVLDSLKRINATQGLLYGLINSDSQPHRNPDSKWYISPEEWREDTYPPWAHGPGYVISGDIAKAIHKQYEEGKLKMFKLEDVAMGIWIADLKKQGLEVKYEMEERVFNDGCKDGYVVAHYQGPREMMCLWTKLRDTKRAICCGE